MSEVIFRIPSDGEIFAMVCEELPDDMYLSQIKRLLPAFHKAFERGFYQGVAHQTEGGTK